MPNTYMRLHLRYRIPGIYLKYTCDKNEDNLKNEDDPKYEDDLKNEDNLKNGQNYIVRKKTEKFTVS